MLTVKCDRCGDTKSHDPKEEYPFRREQTLLASFAQEVRIGPGAQWDGTTWDLCPECFQDYTDLLRNFVQPIERKR